MAFDKPIKNKKIYDYRKENPPFPMDQPEKPRMTVFIRLSSAQYIRTVKNSLDEVLQDLEFKDKGNEITVSAIPPDNFGEDNVLAIVQKHDHHAVKIRKLSVNNY